MTTPAKRIGLWCPHGYKEPGDCLTCSERYSLQPAQQPVTPTPYDVEIARVEALPRKSQGKAYLTSLQQQRRVFLDMCADMGLPPGVGPEAVKALRDALTEALRWGRHDTACAWETRFSRGVKPACNCWVQRAEDALAASAAPVAAEQGKRP